MYTRPHPSASLPQLRSTPNSELSTQHSRRPASGDTYDRPGPPRTTQDHFVPPPNHHPETIYDRLCPPKTGISQ